LHSGHRPAARIELNTWVRAPNIAVRNFRSKAASDKAGVRY
jgi:hypothetical protein